MDSNFLMLMTLVQPSVLPLSAEGINSCAEINSCATSIASFRRRKQLLPSAAGSNCFLLRKEAGEGNDSAFAQDTILVWIWDVLSA